MALIKDNFSLRKKCEIGPTMIGFAVTSITELATEVFVRDVIQRAKCAARITPITTIINKVERGSDRSSFLVFLLIKIRGKTSNVVNNNLYSAIDKGGALQDTINIAANDTDTIEMKSALYGLFLLSFVSTIQ